MNGSYMAAQCSANQEPLAKFGIVPRDGHDLEEQSFAVMPLRIRSGTQFQVDFPSAIRQNTVSVWRCHDIRCPF